MNIGEDIYIVYCRKDDDPGDVKSWAFNFKRFLELLLSRLAGQKITVNMIEDQQLDIDAIYSTTTLLIPLVTPGLLRSTNFNEEIKKFHENAINKEHNNISWNSRIFKVLKHPQKEHYLLDYLNNSVNYNFYHIDATYDQVVVYDDFTGPQSEKTFWMRLYDLAYDVFKIAEKIDESLDEIASINQEINSITVYLATVGQDLISKRDTLKRELLRNGYKVLPESNYPDDLETCVKMIKRDLAKCKMSVHLIGADYGKIKDSNVSSIDLQNRMANEHFRDMDKMERHESLNFGRIIWISSELSNISVKQRLFIENIRKDPESLRNTDLLETTIEELKAFTINKLEKGKETLGLTPTHPKGKIIYLIYDKTENKKCKKIVSYLEKHGYEVLTSIFEGDPDSIRNVHNDYLKRCDATLIYYGKTNEDWMKSKLKDLLKVLGMGRDKPISPQAILIEDERQLDESLGIDKEALILKNTGDFSPKIIEPFLSKLDERA